MPVYWIKVSKEDIVEDRLVEAANESAAIRHVAKLTIEAKRADARKAAELGKQGVEIEVAE